MSISNYSHPRPKLQIWIGRLAVAGIAGAIIGSIGLFVTALSYSAGLLIVMIPFLLGLTMPLFLLIALYPGIEIYEDGLEIMPNGLPSLRLEWQDMLEITEHTLLKPPPPSKFRKKKHEGDMILVKVGKLPFYYRIVSFIAGQDGVPVFAISNESHEHYKELKRFLKQQISGKASPDA